MNETDLAYAAGIIDGEGSIGIYKHPNYVLTLSVANTNKELLERFQGWFGGYIGSGGRQHIARRDKPVWQWRRHGLNAQAALKQVFPYLFLKSRQAAVALVCPVGRPGSGKRGVPSHPLKTMLQEECAKALRKLNARGRVNAAA